MVSALRRVSWFCIALVAAFFVVASVPAWAQLPNLSSDAIQQMLQGRQGDQSQQTDTQQRPATQVYQPVVPERIPFAPPSRLEALYSMRAGRNLQQFGYDVLGVPSAVTANQSGAVQDNYVLGEGDEIVVVLRGQQNETYRQRVNRDGQIILPKLNPVPAAGRRFGDFRADLERQVAQSYISTNAFTSLGEVRQISVLITGEVRAPGQRILGAFASPLDAILLSGGIAKTGSLRNVTIIRGNQSIPLDLYSILTQGTLPDIGPLRNGDRIFVPPLKNTIAVAGYVRRPGIYELRDGQAAMSASALLQLAGGIEIGGNYRFSTTRLEKDGSTHFIPIEQSGSVGTGEVLFVDPTADVALGRVTLAGAVHLPGTYPGSENATLGHLIHGVEDLALDAYAPFSVILRRDPTLNTRILVPVSIVGVLSGKADVPLKSDDVVYVFNRDEIKSLASAGAQLQSRPLTAQLTAGSPDAFQNPMLPNGFQQNPNASFAAGFNAPGYNSNNAQMFAQSGYGQPGFNQPGFGQQQGFFGSPNYGQGFGSQPFQPDIMAPPSVGPGGPNIPGSSSSAGNGNGGYYGPQNGNAYGPQYGGPFGANGFGSPYGNPSGQGTPAFGMQQGNGNSSNPQFNANQFNAGNPAFGGQGNAGQFGTAGGAVDLRLQAAQQQPNPATAALLQSGQLNQQGAFFNPYSANGEMRPQIPVAVIADRLGVSVQALVRLAEDHLVWVLDEVRDPGPYLVADRTTLANMLQTAGGLLREADLSSVEVTSTQLDAISGSSKTTRTDYKGEGADFEKVSLQPLDVIRLRRVFSDRDEGRVTISGQVRYPGSFDITRGEHLSTVLERAGGLTDQAYAYGAVFTREQAALAERDGNIREAREIEAQLSTIASSATNAPDKDAVAYLGSLAQQVRTAPVLGRITVTADPAALRMKPELDVILQPGDTLFIPKRPSTVAVSGEVLNNGSFQYRNGMNIDDYVHLAGGTTKGADDSRIFIVMPDGTAQPAEDHWLSFGNGNVVPPGSTIVVPRDLRPFDWEVFLRDATQVTGQLAVAAASLAVVSENR